MRSTLDRSLLLGLGLIAPVALYVWSLAAVPAHLSYFTHLGVEGGLPLPTAVVLAGWPVRLLAVVSVGLLLVPALLRAPKGLRQALAFAGPWVAIVGFIGATWALKLPFHSGCH